MRINLLPEPSWSQRIRRWVLPSLTTVLLLINVLLIGLWIRADLLIREQENRLAQMEQEMLQLQPAYEEHSRMMRLAEQSDVLEQWAASRPSLRSDLQRLASLLPNRSYITHVELLDEATYWVRAILPDMESVSTYAHATEQHAEIAQVQVLGIEEKEEGLQLEFYATMNRNG